MRHRRGRRCKTSQRARNKLFSPRISRDLTMTAAATPRGRPQYAAPRDEIASSASGGRKNNRPPFPENYRLAEAGGSRDPLGRRCSTSRPRNCSAQQFLSARLFPHSRLVETGGRRHPRRKAAISRLRSSDLRWRRPKNYSAATLLRPTVIDRAPGKFFRFNSSLKRGISLLMRGARGLFRSPAGISTVLREQNRLKSLFRRAGDQNRVFDCAQAARAALTPGRRCLPALGIGLPVATCMVRALELSRSPAGISIDFAYAKRLKSLLRRAGDQRCSAISWNWPQAGRAPRARGERAMLRIAITS